MPQASKAVSFPPATPWGWQVAALPTLARLQPAKQAVLDAVNEVVHALGVYVCSRHGVVYRTFHLQGRGLEHVAAQRGVRLNTVLSYLSEAVLAGHPYDPGALGIVEDRAVAVLAALQQHAPEVVETCRASGAVDVLGALRIRGVGLQEVEGWVEVEGLTGLGELRLLVAHAGRTFDQQP